MARCSAGCCLAKAACYSLLITISVVSYSGSAYSPSNRIRRFQPTCAIKNVFPRSDSTMISRRQTIMTGLLSPLTIMVPTVNAEPSVKVVTDPNTYSALAYSPPKITTKLPPMILFLHGAGKNQGDITNLADINGEHGGLLPSLLATNRAPKEVTENFSVLAPYSYGKTSFYEEPRAKLLQFIDWAASPQGQEAGCPRFDASRVYLFGFSDGATLAVELLTTKRFAGAVICSYGFSGILPDLALQRLQNKPVRVFHSSDDVIFPVRYSDTLVQSLRRVNTRDDVVRYTRFDVDPENFGGSVRGHTTGITASKDPEVYQWLLSI